MFFIVIISVLFSFATTEIIPICLIGSTGYYFTALKTTPDFADDFWNLTGGSLADLHEITYNIDALRQWLVIRREMYPCNVTYAWCNDLDAPAKKTGDSTVPMGLVDPAGVFYKVDAVGENYVLCYIDS